MEIAIRPGTMDEDVVSEMDRDVYHVADYVRNGDLVIDVGANIGAFAHQVKQICPGARVLCLEPMPSNFEALRANIENIATAEQVALVGERKRVTIYDFGPDASACHSIYDLGIAEAVPVEVQGETLQGLLDRHGLERVRFLKLDCQGAEFEIIPATSHDVLARIDYIAMEIHRRIAKTGVMLGEVPEHAAKVDRLYRHLGVTHVPVCGDLSRDSLLVWGNRRCVPVASAWDRLSRMFGFPGRMGKRWHRVH